MIGTSLNQYRITATIGAGGMGEVFRARDTRLNRDVAIKVLPKDFVNDADRLRRFEQEAKTLAALNHPNVLTIHDAGVHDAGVHEGGPYLVSKFHPPGASLSFSAAPWLLLSLWCALLASVTAAITGDFLPPTSPWTEGNGMTQFSQEREATASRRLCWPRL
jgi:hypothetical protein